MPKPPLWAPGAMPPVDEDGISTLVSTLPALLGCYPTSSLVVAYARDTRIVRLTYQDVTAPELVAHCVAEQAEIQADSAFLIVVDQGADPWPDNGRTIPDSLPYDAVLWPVYQAFERAGLPIGHALWTPMIAADGGWCSYEVGHLGGRIPDPALAIPVSAAAEIGRTVYPDRPMADLELVPDQDDLECARLILRECHLRPIYALDSVRRRTVRDAVAHAARGQLPGTPREKTRLAYALEGRAVRDAIIRAILEHDLAGSTHPLWAAMTRATPPPLQTWPALLLGFTAHLRGELALAAAALHTAVQADPNHELAGLLLHLLASGLGQDDVHWSAPDLGPDWGLGRALGDRTVQPELRIEDRVRHR